jgi:predicted NUDIX family NTP pyrophosphohydrolase
MTAVSAGVLLYRRHGGSLALRGSLALLLVHPGGPFWKNRDDGAWSIPKGEVAPGEEPLAAARREFREELGVAFEGPLAPIGSVRQRGGKIVHGFAGEGSFDVASLRSGTFDLEWPPRSGRIASFPEVDRAEWFEPEAARAKILPAQEAFVDRLEALLEDSRRS